MKNKTLLSLCIPTNGVLEWVVPVIESIYRDKQPTQYFEVIITDNGCNEDFELKMKEYEKSYDNFIYKKTSAIQFQNQIEAFNLAEGKLIKFVNHRMLFLPETLSYMLWFVRNNNDKKSPVYFSNGALKKVDEVEVYKNFDDYVNVLTYLSSWSAGIAIWKEDFDKIKEYNSYNDLFPHMELLFGIKDADEFVIINKKLMEEIHTHDTKKGNYNLFYAFSVEYLSLILEMYRKDYITLETFLNIKNDLKGFLADLYFKYIIQKKESSYDLTGYKSSIKVYYKPFEIYVSIIKIIVRKGIQKLAVTKH